MRVELPQVGTVASYTFDTGFTGLNDIYTLTKIMSFETAVGEGVDFIANLYAPAGKTSEDYDTDWAAYKGVGILRLVGANDPSTILYVPETLIALVPDPNVSKINSYYLACDLGEFKDPDDFSYMVDQLNDIAASVTGTAETVKIFVDGHRWMTNSDYQAIVDARASDIEGLELLSKVIQDQNRLMSKQNAKIAALEAALVAAAGG